MIAQRGECLCQAPNEGFQRSLASQYVSACTSCVTRRGALVVQPWLRSMPSCGGPRSKSPRSPSARAWPVHCRRAERVGAAAAVRVLDGGSGAGDVSFLTAELVSVRVRLLAWIDQLPPFAAPRRGRRGEKCPAYGHLTKTPATHMSRLCSSDHATSAKAVSIFVSSGDGPDCETIRFASSRYLRANSLRLPNL